LNHAFGGLHPGRFIVGNIALDRLTAAAFSVIMISQPLFDFGGILLQLCYILIFSRLILGFLQPSMANISLPISF